MITRFGISAILLAVLCFTLPARAASMWTDDFEAAKATAAKDGKDLLLDFTGSDWCGWCIKLKTEVFDQEAFKKDGLKNFVFVEVDFPRKKELPAKIKAQNQALQEQFGIEGFPTILLLDAKGRAYARTGYHAGGPEAYLKHLDELRAKRVLRDTLLAKAEKAGGIEKARVLDELLQNYEDAGVGDGDAGLAAQIIGLDKDDNAGLKSKYESRELAAKGDLDGALKKTEAYLKNGAPIGRAKQDAWFFKSILLYQKEDKKGAIAALETAREAAPDTERGKEIVEILQKLKKEDEKKPAAK